MESYGYDLPDYVGGSRRSRYDLEHNNDFGYNVKPHREPRDFHKEWKARFEATDTYYQSPRQEGLHEGYHGHHESDRHRRHHGYNHRSDRPDGGYHGDSRPSRRYQPRGYDQHHDKQDGRHHSYPKPHSQYQTHSGDPPRYHGDQSRSGGVHGPPRFRAGYLLEAPRPEYPDHYAVLGLKPNATPAE